MVERLGKMRKGRGERSEKGSRERIEKRERAIVSPSPLGMYDMLELKHQNVVFTSF